MVDTNRRFEDSSLIYAKLLLDGWNLHVCRAVGAMVSSYKLAPIPVGSSPTSVIIDKIFLQNFDIEAFYGLGTRCQRSSFLIYFRIKFPSKILLSKPCQVSWAEFTLSGSVLY